MTHTVTGLAPDFGLMPGTRGDTSELGQSLACQELDSGSVLPRFPAVADAQGTIHV